MSRFQVVFMAILIASPAAFGQTPDRDLVTDSLHRAVTFFRQHASAGGGYVFQLSADLQKREGEGRVGPLTAWIEPPATPAVGMAYLQAYRLCDDPILLEAAMDTADALIQGQLRSGGWGEKIDFAPKKRSWHSYRVEPEREQEGRNTTTFDDDKTQSAIRLLVQIDQRLDAATPNKAAADDIVGNGRVDLHPGGIAVKRGDPHIVNSERGHAHEEDLAFKFCRIYPALGDIGE